MPFNSTLLHHNPFLPQTDTTDVGWIQQAKLHITLEGWRKMRRHCRTRSCSTHCWYHSWLCSSASRRTTSHTTDINSTTPVSYSPMLLLLLEQQWSRQRRVKGDWIPPTYQPNITSPTEVVFWNAQRSTMPPVRRLIACCWKVHIPKHWDTMGRSHQGGETKEK